MDCVPITVITLPIFMPIVRALGFDPLWFGLIYNHGALNRLSHSSLWHSYVLL